MHSPCPGKTLTRMPFTSSHFGQSGGKIEGLPLQENHSDCSRVAQHALVLSTDPSVPAHHADSAIQPASTQESGEP